MEKYEFALLNNLTSVLLEDGQGGLDFGDLDCISKVTGGQKCCKMPCLYPISNFLAFLANLSMLRMNFWDTIMFIICRTCGSSRSLSINIYLCTL